MYNPFDLTNKTILVTGASSGIGKGIAEDLSKMGCNVLITARNKERLNKTLSLMEGDNNLIIEADLSNTDDINSLVDNLPIIDGIVL